MSQNDFTIANQGFPSFRSDLNSALQALATNSSGTSEPTTTFAYQWWYDTTNNILKMRNADDDAWIDIAEFDQTNDEWLITKKTSINGSTIVSAGTTAQRDGSPSAGYVRFNTTTQRFEGYNGSSWSEFDFDISAVGEDIVPDADDTHDIGTSSDSFADAWFKGTIHVDNFAPSAGGTEFGIEGIAKSLLVYDQTSNSIEEQVNVSSVTDQATGRFSANHTNNFSNTDQPYTHYGESSERFIDPTRFVSASAMHTATRNSSLAYQDYDNNQLIRCGDLA